jgi:hypothetical protein
MEHSMWGLGDRFMHVPNTSFSIRAYEELQHMCSWLQLPLKIFNRDARSGLVQCILSSCVAEQKVKTLAMHL